MERMTTLAAWESFYVIVGSSAAALTGLQFVVISVVGADPDKLETGTEEIGAFGTPTVVHFCVTLLVAAIVSAPWHALGAVRWAIGLCGIGGLLYTGTVVRRARAQKGYRPVLEDWIWHAVLPAIAYVTLLVASISATGDGRSALFVIAAAALLLLYVGIHNAWDAVVYIALSRRKESKEHR
jgi:hypothetical protein